MNNNDKNSISAITQEKQNTEKELIDLEEINIITAIPENTISLEPYAKLYDNANSSVLDIRKPPISVSEIQQSINDFKDNLKEEYTHKYSSVILTDANDTDIKGVYIIISVPKEAIDVTFRCKLFDIQTNSIADFAVHLDITGIANARHEFLEVIFDGDDYNAEYVVTEEGVKYLRQLQENGEDI